MTLRSSRKWNVKNNIDNVDTLLDTILKDREVEDIKEYLNPNIEDLPSYKKLHNTSKAINEIQKSIEINEKIYIHGDFDVDGISATALLWKFLYVDLAKHIDKKIDVLPYIPDRVDEGYGLSRSSLDSMINGGAKLIITVDCGVRDRVIIEEYLDV